MIRIRDSLVSMARVSPTFRRMSDVRSATPEDRELVARIAAEGFYDDPVLSWVCRDDDRRLEQLVNLMGGLFDDMVPDRGTVHLLDAACTALWRRPDFDQVRPASERMQDAEPAEERAQPVLRRGGGAAHHPRRRDGRGPPARAALVPQRGQHAPVPPEPGPRIRRSSSRCSPRPTPRAWPCYLESSNPRNVSLYLRHGFVETGELPLPDGPSLIQMWRDPDGLIGLSDRRRRAPTMVRSWLRSRGMRWRTSPSWLGSS